MQRTLTFSAKGIYRGGAIQTKTQSRKRGQENLMGADNGNTKVH